MIMPIAVDVDVVELNEAINMDVSDLNEGINAEIEPKLVIPVIPENYCRFTWDGTMLRFE